jgi:hypothetical protein
MAQVRIELQKLKELISSNHKSSAQFCQVKQVAMVNIGQKKFIANKLINPVKEK